MYINQDFKLVKRNKYIIWSIIGFIFLCAVALFIATSWYKNDLAITNYFNKAMRFDFFKGWTGYFIIDANILIISIIVPLVFILIESLYAYLKKNKPNSFGARHYKDKKWFYWVILVVYPIFAFAYMASICFDDQGFGAGFFMWQIIGWEYLIPIYIVSSLINIAICYGLLYYVRHDLSVRKDFLQSRRWARTFVVILMTALVYLVVLILKSGMARPYPMFINWGNYLDKIKAYDPSRYNHYVEYGKHIYGWDLGNVVVDGNFPKQYSEWPWWKIGHGFFNENSKIYDALPSAGDAFPSGHMGMVSIVLAALWYVLFSDINNKKDRVYRWVAIGVGLLYGLNMFFSLLVSENHWASDMAFTLMWTPIAFIISWAIVNGTVNKVTKNKSQQIML